MQFKLLGPMEVLDGLRHVHVPGPKPRAVLALLLLEANRVVSVDRLIDELWSESPPPQATTTLRGYICAIRRALEPDRPPREPSRVLLTREPGYLLVVERGQFDAACFERLAEEGHRRLLEGDPQGALTRLTQALGLWRGPALADFSFEDFARLEATRLEELRLAVTEDQMQAALDCGEHASVVVELGRLVQAHPLRERLRGLLMLALYRSGRQAAALGIYREGRRVLGEELGIDPSPELKALEEAILRQDDLLTWQPSLAHRASRPVAVTQLNGDGGTHVDAGHPAEPISSADAWERACGSEPPFVGRVEELATLKELLEVVGEGTARVALVEGAAGIGKSRLVGEMLAEARARRFQVLYGRAEELERRRPFGVLVDALLCHRSSPDAQRAAIAALLAEGHERQHSGPGLEFRVIELLGEVVARLTGRGPVVLVLEDLHWADPSTLAAFRWLGRRLAQVPLLLVATFRPLPVRSELLGLIEAFSAEQATHLRLAGLDESAVDEFISRVVGAPPGPLLRRRVAGAAGNPLFVFELLRALAEEDRIHLEAGQAETQHWPVPPSLRPTLLRRLRLLPDDTVEVLRLASVLGSTFSVGDLSLVSGRSAFHLLSALGAALGAGLVREVRGQLAFEHDLVREAIYEELPQAVRAALHQDVGRVLAEAGAPATAVATHLALGAPPANEQTVTWLRRAGREVIGSSPAGAAEFLERALDLVGPADPERPELMSELACALMWAGRVTEGAELAHEMLALEHDPAFEGSLRLALGRALMMLGRPSEAIAVDEAGAGLVGLPDWQRVQLRADASFAHMLSGDLETAQRTATAVRALGAHRGDDVIVALSTLSQVAMLRGELADAIVLGRQVVEAVDRCRDRWIRHFPSHYWLALALTLAERFAEAADVVDAGRRSSRERGNVWALPGLHGVAALGGFLAGRWDEAVEEAQAAIALAGDVGARHGLVFAHTVASLISLHRGDLTAAQGALEVASREPSLPYFAPWIAHARALVEEERRGAQAAFPVLAAAWAEARTNGIACAYPTLAPDLVRLALLEREWGLALLVTEEAEGASARMQTASAAAAALRCRGLVDRISAVLLEGRHGLQALPPVAANSPTR